MNMPISRIVGSSAARKDEASAVGAPRRGAEASLRSRSRSGDKIQLEDRKRRRASDCTANGTTLSSESRVPRYTRNGRAHPALSGEDHDV